MIITVQQLQKIASNLDIAEIVAKWTTGTDLDDRLVALLQRIADNEDALELVCKFLNWTQLFSAEPGQEGALEPDLGNLEEHRDILTSIRSGQQAL